MKRGTALAVVFFMVLSGLSLASVNWTTAGAYSTQFSSYTNTTGSGTLTWSSSHSLGTSVFRGGDPTIDSLQLWIKTGSNFETGSVSNVTITLSTSTGYSSTVYGFVGGTSNYLYLSKTFTNLSAGTYSFTVSWTVSFVAGVSVTYEWNLKTIAAVTGGSGSTDYPNAPAAIQAQLPYGTYTLPQFSPFSTFYYDVGNATVNRYNGSTDYINMTSSANYNELYGNTGLSGDASYYINGTYSGLDQSSNGGFLGFGSDIRIRTFTFALQDGQVNINGQGSKPLGASSYTYSILFNGYNQTAIFKANGYTYERASTPLPTQYGLSEALLGYQNVSVPTVTQKTYPVAFQQSGLPSGSLWTLTVNGSSHSTTATSIDLNLATGQYPFTATSGLFTASGSVVVSGNSSSYVANVTFAAGHTVTLTVLTQGYSGSYTAIFSGSSYTLLAPSTTIHLTNETYSMQVINPYGYSSSHPSTLDLQANESIYVNFTVIARYLNFTETGLPSATLWTMYINGSQKSTVGNTVSFFLMPATYTFVAGSVSGYEVKYSVSSPIALNSNTSITVTYYVPPPPSQGNYTFVIEEFGIIAPSGVQAAWTITTNITTYSSSTNYLILHLHYQYLTYIVNSVSDYKVSGKKVITLKGTINETVVGYANYTLEANSVTGGVNGFNSFFPYFILLLGIFVIVVSVAMIRRRSK